MSFVFHFRTSFPEPFAKVSRCRRNKEKRVKPTARHRPEASFSVLFSSLFSPPPIMLTPRLFCLYARLKRHTSAKQSPTHRYPYRCQSIGFSTSPTDASAAIIRFSLPSPPSPFLLNVRLPILPMQEENHTPSLKTPNIFRKNLDKLPKKVYHRNCQTN